MKLSRLFVPIAVGLASAGLSNAQSVVYMTGSTAFRAEMFSIIPKLNLIYDAAPQVTTWGNSTANKASYMAFKGHPVGGGAGATLTIQCAWSGSDAGITDVAPTTPAKTENFSNDALDGTVHAGAPGSFAAHTVDLAMADNEQAFAAIYGNNPGTPPAAIANENQVGVVTFKWVRNPGNWTGGNVSSSQIRQALTGAGAKQSVFDGSNNTHFVYVSGRNSGSGTRANTFGDTQFGIFNGPNQIEINSTGNMVQDTDVNGVLTYIGDIGFSSGGSLAGTLGGNSVGKTDQVQGGGLTSFSVIAYLGFNDATTATGNGAVELTYNGVPYSIAGVENGTYTFWGYEYILEKNGAVAPVTTVYAALSGVNGIPSVLYPAAGTTPNGIQLGQMLTVRSGPNGDPQHNP